MRGAAARQPRRDLTGWQNGLGGEGLAMPPELLSGCPAFWWPEPLTCPGLSAIAAAPSAIGAGHEIS